MGRRVVVIKNGTFDTEIDIGKDAWISNETLEALNLSAGGMLVPGTVRHGEIYLGAPGGEEALAPGDTLVAYGPEHRLQGLSKRDKNDVRAREMAINAHTEETDEADPASYSEDRKAGDRSEPRPPEPPLAGIQLLNSSGPRLICVSLRGLYPPVCPTADRW